MLRRFLLLVINESQVVIALFVLPNARQNTVELHDKLREISRNEKKKFSTEDKNKQEEFEMHSDNIL